MRPAYLMILAFAAGCARSESAENSPAPAKAAPAAAVKVTTAPVQIQKMPRYLTLTGSIMADRQSEVAANVAGRILQANVERGQKVSSGQILAVVDSRAAGFTTEAALAQSKAAETQQKLAQADCDRADALYAKGASSKAEYDRMKSQCESQVYTASAARANADLAAKNLGDTHIRAPFDGIVGERYVNPGEYVQAASKVASLYRIDPVRIQVSVPEAATPLIKQGAMLNVRVSAFGERDFPATVRYVAPTLRPSTRDLLVEAVADNKDGALRPGMFATVQLLVGEADQPTVAADAVQVEGTTRRIFLSRGGQAWEMVVRTGATRQGRVAVLEPLAAGEQVILKPPPGLHDGSAVQ
jgi:membrane fusion protein (multidrug efflux system)